MATEIGQIRAALLAQGWRIAAGSKHDKAYPPETTKPMVILPKTPSGGRWKENLIAQLRRSGFVWKGRS